MTRPRLAWILTIASSASAACSSQAADPPPPAPDAAAAPPIVAPVTADDRYLVVSLTMTRFDDPDPVRAAAAWPTVTAGVTDTAAADRAWAAMQASFAARPELARPVEQTSPVIRLALRYDAPQSFVIPVDDGFRLLFQTDGWQHAADGTLALAAVRWQSSEAMPTHGGSHGWPVQPTTYTMTPGSVTVARGLSFENDTIARVELLRIRADELATEPPAGAATSEPSTAARVQAEWDAWKPVEPAPPQPIVEVEQGPKKKKRKAKKEKKTDGSMDLGTLAPMGRGEGQGYGAGAGRLDRPAKGTPTTTLDELSVRGFPRDVARRILMRNMAQLRMCYERRLLFDPSLAGEVTSSFQIDATGAATDVDSTGLDAELAKCVTRTLTTMTFPAPDADDAPVEIRSVLRFAPTGG